MVAYYTEYYVIRQSGEWPGLPASMEAMARRKLSEYRAKVLLGDALGNSYGGMSIDTATDTWKKAVRDLPAHGRYVVKVDQAVKRRYHLKLLYLDRSVDQIETDVAALAKKGYRYCVVEPFIPHSPQSERYLALERRREGVRVSYGAQGGVDVEHNPEAVDNGLLSDPKVAGKAAQVLGVPREWLERLGAAFDRTYMSFLEINPLVVDGDEIAILDAAAEVDDAAALLVDGVWTSADFRRFSTRPPSKSENAVGALAERSAASFSLELLNPDGAIFLLLSGGGASVVAADAVADQGAGAQLANYGEYSGGPSADETYEYTLQVLKLLLASAAPHKVLVVAGGVANFTDIRVTFSGIIRALTEFEAQLQAQDVRVFVRRGGPHESEGLAAIRTFLDKAGLLGDVAGPELGLTEIIGRAVAAVAHA